jgi:hypothetical protein
MHADLFGDLLDHHRLQVLDAALEKFALAAHDRLAGAQDGVLALLDVADQLERGR